MFRDEQRDKVWNEIRQADLRSFAKQLTPEVFAEASLNSGERIGQSALNVVNLVWLGISSAIHATASFPFVLNVTLKLLEDQENFATSPVGIQKKQGERAEQKDKKNKQRKKSKHDPHRKDPTRVSEEAFAQARKRMSLKFWMALLMILTRQFQQQHSRHVYVDGFRLLAMDGTTFAVPKVARLIDYYGQPKNGARKQAAPQARMVLLTLPGMRIPIAYEVSPLSDSELTLAQRLMKHICKNDLLLMDRGFISYGLFWQIQNSKAFFGTRLKKNMNLKRVRKLGAKDWLVKWTPKDSRGQWKDLPRSMDLRVIHYQFPGFRASAIVTNVLDPKRLSREDWVRMVLDCDDNGKFTPGLYHRRWEIETTFFEIKVVLKLKSLRSHTPESIEYEVAGRVVYYLLIRWLMVQAAEKHGVDPLRISFTNAVRELELMRASFLTSDIEWARRVLLPRLLERIASHVVPLRPGRHYPRPGDTKAMNCGRYRKKQPPPKLTTKVNTKPKNNIRKRCRKA